MNNTQLPTLYIRKDVALEDNQIWQFRFNVESESSNRLYVISQHKEKRYWGCSCPSWRVRRICKHLTALGLPGNETPYQPKIID